MKKKKKPVDQGGVHVQKDEPHKTRSVHSTAAFKLENRSNRLAVLIYFRKKRTGGPILSKTFSFFYESETLILLLTYYVYIYT